MKLTRRKPAPMKIVGVCPECCLDEAVFCPRDVDGKCAHCARVLCAAHMIAHWNSVHCIALDLAHCRRDVAKPTAGATKEGP